MALVILYPQMFPWRVVCVCVYWNNCKCTEKLPKQCKEFQCDFHPGSHIANILLLHCSLCLCMHACMHIFFIINLFLDILRVDRGNYRCHVPWLLNTLTYFLLNRDSLLHKSKPSISENQFWYTTIRSTEAIQILLTVPIVSLFWTKILSRNTFCL